MKALWSGALSFGLINIPIKLHSGSRERSLKFKLVDKESHCPISYQKVCRSDNKIVDQKDIVRAYELEKGSLVILDDEDFRRADPKKAGTIEILRFSDQSDIEPKYFDKPYLLEPEKKALKAYILLRDALKRTGKIGIARFVMRDREHIGAIVADGKLLELIQLRFDDEVIAPSAIRLPSLREDYTASELDMAAALIGQLSRSFNPADFEDTYAVELLKLIKEKAKGRSPKARRESMRVESTEMADLLSMLKKSLREK